MSTCMKVHVFCVKTVFIKTQMKDYELYRVKKTGFI